MDEILHLEKEFKSKIDQSDNLHKIEQIKSEAFGKNGPPHAAVRLRQAE
jgi:hypothetical protein